MKTDYGHGYSQREALRLSDQARIMAEILHEDPSYPSQSRVLEAGCTVRAQTVLLTKKSPKAYITSTAISQESINHAQAAVDLNDAKVKKNRLLPKKNFSQYHSF